MADVCDEVTHVVAADHTDKTQWALAAGKFVVAPNWLWCCGELRGSFLCVCVWHVPMESGTHWCACSSVLTPSPPPYPCAAFSWERADETRFPVVPSKVRVVRSEEADLAAALAAAAGGGGGGAPQNP